MCSRVPAPILLHDQEALAIRPAFVLMSCPTICTLTHTHTLTHIHTFFDNLPASAFLR